MDQHVAQSDAYSAAFSMISDPIVPRSSETYATHLCHRSIGKNLVVDLASCPNEEKKKKNTTPFSAGHGTKLP